MQSEFEGDGEEMGFWAMKLKVLSLLLNGFRVWVVNVGWTDFIIILLIQMIKLIPNI